MNTHQETENRAGGALLLGRGETERHRRLKQLAVEWARVNGFAIAAGEVRVPRSGYRADVAACSRGAGRRTAVFECKQARADLLKDAHGEAVVRARLAELIERRKSLEEMLAVHRPDLRRGEALWPEFDAWDFSGLKHATYRSVLVEIETLQRRVRGGTKFSKMFRYRCADFLYLVVEENIFAEAEIPAGWGLLVRSATEAGEVLCVARAPAALGAAEEQRVALLEAIALAATRRTRLESVRGVGAEEGAKGTRGEPGEASGWRESEGWGGDGSEGSDR
jgi:hypothetical protein